MRQGHERCRTAETFQLSAAALFLSFALAGNVVVAEHGIQDDAESQGYNCLFMGHSFFAPVANALPAHAQQVGLLSHRQMVVAIGGLPGTAGKLWNSTQAKVVKAKELIETGDIDLVGLTYHPDGGSDVADYGRWVDLAVSHNPKTMFLIQAPWAFKKNRNFAEFEEETEKWHAAVHGVIDGLRRAYPETRFFCIPQGQWMVELWRLFDAGKIPELTELVAKPKGSRQHALFGDQLGHAGILPLRAGALLWLAAIYNVDLNRHDFATGTQADVKGLAHRLVREDPYCGFSRDGSKAFFRPSIDTAGRLSASNTGSGSNRYGTALAAACEFDARMHAFLNEHGSVDFIRHVGSYDKQSFFAVDGGRSNDRLAPRRIFEQFVSYADARLKDHDELHQLLMRYVVALVGSQDAPASPPVPQGPRAGLSQACVNMLVAQEKGVNVDSARHHHDRMVRFFEGILAWFQVEYAFLLQDARLALAATHLLFEEETDARWKISRSPGCFSILVRARDVEVLDEFARRYLAYDMRRDGTILETGLTQREQTLVADSLLFITDEDGREAVKRTLIESIRNPLELVYWRYALDRFSRHPDGVAMLGRVWGMCSRRGIGDSRLLYERMREATFPGNAEAIWPRLDMSRFDPRIHAIADQALDKSPLKEFEKVQAQIHGMVGNGVLRGGGIAEYVRPLGLHQGQHGMNHFLDFGVGGCEAFSSFVTAPMLSLGNCGVHPVFISRPWQPWGHWVAGLDFEDTLYFCDGANLKHKPPVSLKERVDGLFRAARPEVNRYLQIKVYSQTLASWEWEWMLHGSAKWPRTQQSTNPVYAALLRSRLKQSHVGGFKLEDVEDSETANLFLMAHKWGE